MRRNFSRSLSPPETPDRFDSAASSFRSPCHIIRPRPRTASASCPAAREVRAQPRRFPQRRARHRKRDEAAHPLPAAHGAGSSPRSPGTVGQLADADKDDNLPTAAESPPASTDASVWLALVVIVEAFSVLSTIVKLVRRSPRRCCSGREGRCERRRSDDDDGTSVRMPSTAGCPLREGLCRLRSLPEGRVVESGRPEQSEPATRRRQGCQGHRLGSVAHVSLNDVPRSSFSAGTRLS